MPLHFRKNEGNGMNLKTKLTYAISYFSCHFFFFYYKIKKLWGITFFGSPFFLVQDSLTQFQLVSQKIGAKMAEGKNEEKEVDKR